MKLTLRKWLAASSLLAASGLGLWGVAAPLTGSAAHAAAPASQLGSGLPVAGQQVRRESTIPTWLGPVPLTGPASPYNPLDIPNFGDNHRANTDPQSPNLAQQEPSISINPTNPLNVVASAKDERGGTNTKQTWIYSSTDGGVTWINQMFPFAPSMSGFSSDPVVNFSDDGICYVTSLPYGSGGAPGIQVAASTNGGITFSPGVHLPGTNQNTDKEWTWVDNFPSSPYYHRLYTSWMDFGSGNVWRLNYSSDRGASWSQPSAAFSASQFPMPVVLPNGDVLVTYSTSGVTYRRSTDGGATFGNPQSVSSQSSPPCPPDNSGCGIWRLSALPATGVDRTNGSMVITWSDGRTGQAMVYYTRSTDGGATWSAAAQMAPPGVANTYQVEPWVEADENGIFHAIWYDDRENPNTSIFNIYYSQSTDDGATWSDAVRISTATSDLRIGIPSSYSRAAGDYINVTAHSGNVYGVWTDTRAGNGEDVYVVRGTYGGGTPVPTRTRTITPTRTASPTNTAVASTPTATQCAMNFSDVSPNDYFYEAVHYLYCAGVISGYGDGTFRPYNNTTRAQLTKIIVLAEGWPIDTTGGPHFSDVSEGSTFYDYIETAYNHAIISGYGDGTFRPDNNVTRAQLSKIIVLAQGWPIDTSGGPHFSDVPEGSTFYGYVETAFNHGIVTGYGDGTFRPDNNATRGQISVIVYRAITNP